MKQQPGRAAIATAYLLVIGLLGLSLNAQAQLPPLGPTPTPAPQNTPKPPPSPGTTPAPSPTATPGLPFPSNSPAPGSPSPGASPSPGESPSPSPGAEAGVTNGIPPGFVMPNFARTSAQNSRKLVEVLSQATQSGMPIQDALVKGMGRFPVGGLAFWSDDWMNPRFTPVFHLHEGLDIFADFGTPLRAVDVGVVDRITNGAVGGLSVWLRGKDGTQYYYAHMQSIAEGIEAGTPVQIGTVLGYVGDSGNARGGAPHVHFEVHRPDAVPPKPYADAWLAEAEANAPTFVDSVLGESISRRRLLRGQPGLSGLLEADRGGPAATPEYSVLLALLDPVSGSIGMLPDIALVTQRATEPSTALIDEFVRQRVFGEVLGGGVSQGDGSG